MSNASRLTSCGLNCLLRSHYHIACPLTLVPCFVVLNFSASNERETNIHLFSFVCKYKHKKKLKIISINF